VVLSLVSHPMEQINLMTLMRLRKNTRVLSSTGSTSQLMLVLLLPVLCWFGYKIM